jgi:hypothetical protein
MVIVFLVLLVSFCAAQAYAAFQLFQRKKYKIAKKVLIPSVLYLLFLLVLLLWKISIPYLILIFAMAAVFTHTYIGFYLNCYNRSKSFDRYLHGYGTFSTSLLFYLTLSKITEAGGSVLFRAVFVAALGIATGMAYEIMEFLHDLKSSEKKQRGLKDTDFDMLADIIGGIAAAVFAAFTYLV